LITFYDTFDTSFGLDIITPTKNTLNKDCRTGIDCNISCCNSTNCDKSHNNGSMRTLSELLRDSFRYTIGVVGHRLCNGRDHYLSLHLRNLHGKVAGSSEFPWEGRRSIITTESGYNEYYLMQHELSHNLGINTHCTDRCVMNENDEFMNTWCDNHARMIRNRKDIQPN
jgi:hypothetical protein